MNTSQKELKLVPVRCPKCEMLLFRISPTRDTFSIEIKCRRCTLKRRLKTKRRRVSVYVLVQISLEPAEGPGIDSKPENPARD